MMDVVPLLLLVLLLHLQTFPTSAPTPKPVGTTRHFWNIVRTAAGWLTVGITKTNTTQVLLSTNDGKTWTVQYTVPNAGGVTTLWIGQPGDAAVFALAALKNATWLDIFRADDGGKTFKPLNVLKPGRVGIFAAVAF